MIATYNSWARRRASLKLLALAAGPGILVMIGENDGPSMLSYAATGAAYGIGFFVPFTILTFAMAYVVQEMVARIGIATKRGHAELIRECFGPHWSAFSGVSLVIGNALTLVTEFIAIRAGAAYFGVPVLISVGLALALVVAASVLRCYLTWERIAMVLAAGNLLFIPVALHAHPDGAALARAFGSWGPLPGGPTAAFYGFVLATIGATVTPWMLFFQQSAVVNKGFTRADLGRARLDTGFGAGLAAVIAIATIAAASVLFVHHVDAGAFGGADFATALRPFVGAHAAALFALGMIEAGVVAALTISASSSYTMGEVILAEYDARRAHSNRVFAPTAIASAALGAVTVIIPHAPLLTISLGVNVLAAVLMSPALVMALLLANKPVLMGTLRNGRIGNLATGAIILIISGFSIAYAVKTVLAL